MQGAAHRARSGEELRGHGLDPLSQARLIQVHAKHILAAVQGLEAAHVLLSLPDLKRGHDGLELRQQGVGRGREGAALVVHALEIPGVARQHQGDEHQIVQVQATRQ